MFRGIGSFKIAETSTDIVKKLSGGQFAPPSIMLQPFRENKKHAATHEKRNFVIIINVIWLKVIHKF